MGNGKEVTRRHDGNRALTRKRKMLTLFTTPKAFRGHIAVIQRNALMSWTRLHADMEILVFGDDEGTVETARELGVQHIGDVAKNSFGTNRVDDMFARAQAMSRHRALCYVNCDIVLTHEFVDAARRALEWSDRFLMIGRRWDTDVTEPIDFSCGSWEKDLMERARTIGYQRAAYNIDYFLFTKGLFAELLPLAIGRYAWDNYLVWKAREINAAVVDASAVVPAIHQNHDYAHYPGGAEALWHGEEAKLNLRLAGGGAQRRTIDDAQWRLTRAGMEKNWLYWLAPAKRVVSEADRLGRAWLRPHVWHPLLNATRTVRHALGLRREAVPDALRLRNKKRRHWQDVG